jgi:hypothetical protein
MKKSIVLVFAIIMASTAMIAQEAAGDGDARQKLVVGLKAGGNYSNVYDSKGEEFRADGKAGFVGGAFASIPIGTFLGIQPEFLYSQKGFQGSGNILGLPYKLTRTTTFIDVPVLIQLKPSSFFTIVAGPQYSYLIKQKDVFENGLTTIEQENEFENANLRKNIFCFTGGFDVNVTNMVLGARVGWDIQNNNGDGSTTTPRYKNMWYQLTIGFRFYN